jgi:hypothetical protein
MRCLACGTEMQLVSVTQAQSEATGEPKLDPELLERQTFTCLQCSEIEQRLAAGQGHGDPPADRINARVRSLERLQQRCAALAQEAALNRATRSAVAMADRLRDRVGLRTRGVALAQEVGEDPEAKSAAAMADRLRAD